MLPRYRRRHCSCCRGTGGGSVSYHQGRLERGHASQTRDRIRHFIYGHASQTGSCVRARTSASAQGCSCTSDADRRWLRRWASAATATITNDARPPARTHTCARAHAHAHAYASTRTQARAHAHAHAGYQALWWRKVQRCRPKHMCACKRASERACVRACVLACAHVDLFESMYSPAVRAR